jgi:multisite-specific tRNA:(cytosine-C5)-methyltransferase
MRIYPYQQDTGGFFIAVLERKCSTKKSASPGVECPVRYRKREADKSDDSIHAKKLRLNHGDAVEMDVMDGSESAELVQASTSVSTSNDDQGEVDSVAGTSVGLKEQVNDSSFKENPYTFLESSDRILQSCM